MRFDEWDIDIIRLVFRMSEYADEGVCLHYANIYDWVTSSLTLERSTLKQL